MIYLVSDTNFNHEKMVVDWKLRPTDYEEKIHKELKTLTSKDMLIHLGDICIGKDTEMHKKYIAPIPSKKILVKGNHDNKSTNWYLNNGWDFACERFINTYYGTKFIFNHRPLELTGDPETYVIHAHSHHLGINYRNLRPISLEENNYKLTKLVNIAMAIKYCQLKAKVGI